MFHLLIFDDTPITFQHLSASADVRVPCSATPKALRQSIWSALTLLNAVRVLCYKNYLLLPFIFTELRLKCSMVKHIAAQGERAERWFCSFFVRTKGLELIVATNDHYKK